METASHTVFLSAGWVFQLFCFFLGIDDGPFNRNLISLESDDDSTIPPCRLPHSLRFTLIMYVQWVLLDKKHTPPYSEYGHISKNVTARQPKCISSSCGAICNWEVVFAFLRSIGGFRKKSQFYGRRMIFLQNLTSAHGIKSCRFCRCLPIARRQLYLWL